MEFVPLWETERRNTHKFISMGILILWLMTFVMNGIALYIYSNAQRIAEEYRVRTLLLLQADLLLVQAISSILWFIVATYIFLSTLIFEEREKYNIISGAMFLISGIAELIIAIYLLRIRDELLDVVHRYPLISIDELQELIIRLNRTLVPLSIIANVVISLSIGSAFILLGIGVRKMAWKLEKEISDLAYMYTSVSLPQEAPEGLETQIYQMNIPAIWKMREGIKKMYSGGTMYLLSGVFDIVGIFMPFMAFLAFVFFIIGMMQIGAGRKMIEEGKRQMVIPPQLEIERKQEGEFV